MTTAQHATLEQREAALSQAVSREVSNFDGWKVESRTMWQAVLVKGGKPNHLLHLILTFFTFGFWIPVWMFISFMSRRQTLVLTVDEAGRVIRQR